MRCARCDRPALPPTLGRDPAGRLVFGWCASCLAEAGCTPAEGPSLPLRVRRPPWRRRLRRLTRAWRRSGGLHGPAGRRLVRLGLAATASAGSLGLALAAALRASAPGPPPSPSGATLGLIAGSALLALGALALRPSARRGPGRPGPAPRLAAFVLGLVPALATGLYLASLRLGHVALVAGWGLALYLLSRWLSARTRRRGDGGPRAPAASTAR